ncbi:MAG: glyoxalase/bleomycin resistance protein/dioxygenase [Actinomycetia bacterium]|nr:glyoxalase/bleomycin resistance protein/dioxygenase [Actinomycetes bacterium]
MPLDDARLFHVNVNCSDLERSCRFYTEGIGLEIGARTAPETAQPGAAFGLDRARWDASILLGPRGYDGGAVDLLQWQEPAPVGAPPTRLFQTGFQRLGLRVPDLDGALVRVGALGGAVWSEPVTHTLAAGGEIRLTMVNDPDGTAIELIEGGAAALSFVAVTCADLERSLDFYASLGFREVARYPSENADGSHLHVEGTVAMDEIVLTAPGGGDVLFILVGFRAPLCERNSARAANTLGMWRAAFLIADVDKAVAELARHDVATISPPVEMAMGRGLPNLRFVCFRGPDDEVVELIEQPALDR